MLNDKVIIVTGGTYGLGRTTVEYLCQQGAHVVACGLDDAQPGSVAKDGSIATKNALAKFGLSAEILEADVSNRDDVTRVVDYTVQKFGGIDGLVNNAAIHPSGKLLDTDDELWHRVNDVNLSGTFYMCREVLPHMISRGGGSIVNLSSGAAWGQANLLAYCASKGGILSLSAAIAVDYKDQNIRCNVVVPALMESGMTEHLLAARPEMKLISPALVSPMIGFLLSDEAVAVCGAVIPVNRISY